MIKEKPPLSWTKQDYKQAGEEAPGCVANGKTEGEVMEPEDIISWSQETLRCIKVLREEYPQKAEEQIAEYMMDLNYLKSLGKITVEQIEQLSDEENYNFE